MKRILLTDLIGQSTLILVTLILLLTSYEPAIYCYFGLGAWQVVFCFIYLYQRHCSYARRVYNGFLLGISILGLASLPAFSSLLTLVFLYVLLFVPPLMALYNYCLTCSEYKNSITKHYVFDL